MEVAWVVGLEAAHSVAAGSAVALAVEVEGAGVEAAGAGAVEEGDLKVATVVGLVDLEEVLAVHLEGARLEAAGSVAV
jgi:hypothetical protein